MMKPTEPVQLTLQAAGLMSRSMAFSAQTYLFRSGDPVSRLFFIVSGKTKMVRTLESGQEIALQRARAGSFLAEASLFADRHHCDALCESDVTCIVYEKMQVLEALKTPEIAEIFLKIYAQSIRDLRSQIELRNIKRADHRLFAYLISLNEDELGWRDPHMRWKEVSKTLGLTHEAIYRALNTLSRSGQIERKDGKVRLLSENSIRIAAL